MEVAKVWLQGKWQSMLQNVKGDNLESFLKLKSLSKTRWACHWEAVKAIERKFFRIPTALVKISDTKEAKLSVDFINCFLQFRFHFGIPYFKSYIFQYQCSGCMFAK